MKAELAVEDLAVTAAAVALALAEHYLWRRLLRPPLRRILGIR